MPWHQRNGPAHPATNKQQQAWLQQKLLMFLPYEVHRTCTKHLNVAKSNMLIGVKDV